MRLIKRNIIYILVAIFCLLSTNLFSQTPQTITAQKLVAIHTIYLRGVPIDTISVDTNLTANSDDVLSTQRAIKTYIKNHFDTIYAINGLFATSNGDSLGWGGPISRNTSINAKNLYTVTFDSVSAGFFVKQLSHKTTLLGTDSVGIFDTSGQLWKIAASAIISGGGGGSPNSNIGAGYRLAVPGTNNVKTLFGKNGVLLDSTSNANGITFQVDSSIYATKSFVNNLGAVTAAGNGLRLIAPGTVGLGGTLSGGGGATHIDGPNQDMDFDSLDAFNITTYSAGSFASSFQIEQFVTMISEDNPFTSFAALSLDEGIEVDLHYFDPSGTSELELKSGHTDATTHIFNFFTDSSLITNGIFINKLPYITDTTNQRQLVWNRSTGKVSVMTVGTGGGGGTTFTNQNITSGSSGTGSTTPLIVTFNPSSLIASYNFTLPPSPLNNDEVIIRAGGTIPSGVVVTSFTLTPNGGQTITDPNIPTSLIAGQVYKLRWSSTYSTWYPN